MGSPIDADDDFWSSEAAEESAADDPEIPTIDGQPAIVDYSIRGPNDWVVSGPLQGWYGRGRMFPDERAAMVWAREKYGVDRITRIYGGVGRWAILVRPPK